MRKTMDCGSVGNYEMLDGRIVTVDFSDAKSVANVSKSDWPTIRLLLREQLRFVQSKLYKNLVKEDLTKFLNG